MLPLLRPLLLSLALLATALRASAQEALPENFRRLELTVDGVARTALIYAPPAAKTTPAPLIFAFHGHGGTARSAMRSFPMDREWPEAISVYMQGLNTPGRLTDPEGKKPGWQSRGGDQGDRDLKFFDAVLAKMKADYKVDERRVYGLGHSNGGGFTYLLWAMRGDLFAAMAPSGSAAAQTRALLKPKPVLHAAGEADPLVKFAWQRATMDRLRKLNGCVSEGKPWGENCTIYESPKGTPVVEFIHSGGHEFPATVPPAMVRFFKQHPAPGA